MRYGRGYGCAAKAALCMLTAALPGWQLRGATGACAHSNGITVVATPISATAVSLFWQVTPGSGGSKPVNSYRLFRGTSPSNITQLATVTQPFYVDLGVEPATTYLYVVGDAVNGSVLSGSACATTPPLPNAPYDLAATAASPTQVTLSWAEKIDPDSLAIAEFRVFAGTSPSNLTQVAAVKAVTVTLNASAGTTYYYAVAAVDVDGDASPLSTIVQVTTPNQ